METFSNFESNSINIAQNSILNDKKKKLFKKICSEKRFFVVHYLDLFFFPQT